MVSMGSWNRIFQQLQTTINGKIVFRWIFIKSTKNRTPRLIMLQYFCKGEVLFMVFVVVTPTILELFFSLELFLHKILQKKNNTNFSFVKLSIEITSAFLPKRDNSCKNMTLYHYVLKFVSDLRQVGGFLWTLRFPPPIKLIFTGTGQMPP
jgi:hypothetical protein